MAERGHRTGILDLTRGEMGTRGTAEDRAREATEAARLLQVSWREALDIPDGRVENTWENRLKVARVIRQTRPRVVILPYWEGRHPDHYTASKLGFEACFLAGLAKLDVDRAISDEQSAFSQVASAVASVVAGEKQHVPSAAKTDRSRGIGGTIGSRALPGSADPRNAERSSLPDSNRVAYSSSNAGEAPAPHRPFKIIYATLYYDIRPTFVVDITAQFGQKLKAIQCYTSQFSPQKDAQNLFPSRADLRERIGSLARHFGLMIGVRYGEPFVMREVAAVDDIVAMPVKSV